MTAHHALHFIPPGRRRDYVGIDQCFPWYHRDPFDRLLVAQAQEQSLPAYLLTTDGMLKQYSELVVHLSIRTTQGS